MRSELFAATQISIHALREESDAGCIALDCNVIIFQSTLSVRRATAGHFRDGQRAYISIHALREESDRVQLRLGQVGAISIHALREESDRLSQRGGAMSEISIHALREESDCATRDYGPTTSNFNPRSP